MTKHLFILLLFIGVFFTPVNIFACGKDGVNHTCKTTHSTNKSKAECSCCNKKNNSHNNCCGHSKCGCSATCHTSIALSVFLQSSQNNNYDFSFIEKVKFPSYDSSVSEGFYSIWLIPKIS